MVGRLDDYLPVSGSVAFVQAPRDAVAETWMALSKQWGVPLSRSTTDLAFPKALTALEPIDGARELVVGGGSWSALFKGSAGADLDSATSNLASKLGCRAIYADSSPNLYGGGGYNTRLTLYDGDDTIREISVVRAERWSFDVFGDEQDWELPETYKAKKIADRFPPALLNQYLDALGVPALDSSAWGPGGVVLTDPKNAEQSGETIAELHARMYS